MVRTMFRSARLVIRKSYIQEFGDYVRRKRSDGTLSPGEVADIMQEIVDVLAAAGISVDGDPLTRPVIRQALHNAKTKLIELHPDLADEVARLGRGNGIGRN